MGISAAHSTRPRGWIAIPGAARAPACDRGRQQLATSGGKSPSGLADAGFMRRAHALIALTSLLLVPTAARGGSIAIDFDFSESTLELLGGEIAPRPKAAGRPPRAPST